jgi:hypothetical protein
MRKLVAPDPLDVGFVKVIKAYYQRTRQTEGQKFCEEREYRVGTQRGQFQLWIDCKYARAIPLEEMVMPKSDPLDFNFVRVLEVYYERPRRRRFQNINDVKTEVHEERQYRLGNDRGLYQLWINGKYNSDITSIMSEKKSREELILSFLDDGRPWSDHALFQLPKSDSQKKGGVVGSKARVEAADIHPNDTLSCLLHQLKTISD